MMNRTTSLSTHRPDGPPPGRPTHAGPAVIDYEVPLAPETLALIRDGVAGLWRRIVSSNPKADERPLLLSYDVHPTPDGPVLIEVNTNAGGIVSAMQAARQVNDSCADMEQQFSRGRLLALFRRDLLGQRASGAGCIAIVDDDLEQQPLYGEMLYLADLFRDADHEVLVVDASELSYTEGHLRFAGTHIDRVYWRSTDFLLRDDSHRHVREALMAGAISLAPSPQAYQSIAAKSRFVDWSSDPVLAKTQDGLAFRIAETQKLASRSTEAWYAQRRDWVFKPIEGAGSRGVYVGKSISRKRLASLEPDYYLAQRYAPHPKLQRDDSEWKYDLRFYADRGEIIGAAARVFQGQVVGLRTAGSGFAPVRVGDACCIQGALNQVP